jgi:hypothetical protein
MGDMSQDPHEVLARAIEALPEGHPSRVELTALSLRIRTACANVQYSTRVMEGATEAVDKQLTGILANRLLKFVFPMAQVMDGPVYNAQGRAVSDFKARHAFLMVVGP